MKVLPVVVILVVRIAQAATPANLKKSLLQRYAIQENLDQAEMPDNATAELEGPDRKLDGNIQIVEQELNEELVKLREPAQKSKRNNFDPQTANIPLFVLGPQEPTSLMDRKSKSKVRRHLRETRGGPYSGRC